MVDQPGPASGSQWTTGTLQVIDKRTPCRLVEEQHRTHAAVLGVPDTNHLATKFGDLHAVTIHGAPRTLPPRDAILDVPAGLDVLPKRHRTRHLR